MQKFLFAAAAFGLVAVATAQNATTPAGQPTPGKAVQGQPKATTQPAQPGGFGQPGGRVTPARLSQLEEDVEILEANRDVRKAYIRATEIGVKSAEIEYAAIAKVAASGAAAVSSSDLDRAKAAVEAAKAQVDIRMAEMKEVEVKIKFAKKRLDDAKAAGVRVPADNPFRRGDPVPSLPVPPPAVDDKEKAIAELKAKLEKLTAEAEKQAEVAKKAEVEAKSAQADLAKLLDVARRGKVRAGTIEAAEEKAREAQAAADAAKKKAKALEEEVAAVKAKIKETEK